jgi:modulator of FtsH protease HflK
MTRRIIVGIVLIALAAGYLGTGWVVVAPGEEAVVRRFGRVLPEVVSSGPHLGGPLGVDRVTRVRTDEVRRLTVGLSQVPGASEEPGAGEFLTGDLNLVRAEATVQYRVADPVAFVLAGDDAVPILKQLAEASLGRSLARQAIDATLRESRASAARETETALARGVERYRLGLSVLGVSVTDARPPSEVADAFALAQSASSEHDQRINEARTYALTTRTRAEAEGRARLEQAHARADRTLALAKSKTSRFLVLLAEADKARALTIRRLYLEAVRDLLPRVRRKVVLTPDEPVDLSLFGLSH